MNLDEDTAPFPLLHDDAPLVEPPLDPSPLLPASAVFSPGAVVQATGMPPSSQSVPTFSPTTSPATDVTSDSEGAATMADDELPIAEPHHEVFPIGTIVKVRGLTANKGAEAKAPHVHRQGRGDGVRLRDVIGSVAPPALEGIASAVVGEYPELKVAYDTWWAKTGPGLTTAYETATSAEFWPCVSAHLHDAAPFMVATHEEHLDDDAEGVAALEEAPKTTDPNESMFAVFDHVLRVSQGASVHAVLGVAHAQGLKAFETVEGLAARARRKRKPNETADDDAGNVAAWKATSFFGLQRAAVGADQRRAEKLSKVVRVHEVICKAGRRGRGDWRLSFLP
jgi:hypothetical protein